MVNFTNKETRETFGVVVCIRPLLIINFQIKLF